MRSELHQLFVQARQVMVLRVYLGQSLIQCVGSVLNAVNRLNAASKVFAPFAQLRVQLGSCSFVPQFNLTQGCLVHHAQAGGQGAHQPVGKLRLCQAQGIAYAQVLGVAALDQVQVTFVAHHLRFARHLQ